MFSRTALGAVSKDTPLGSLGVLGSLLKVRSLLRGVKQSREGAMIKRR